MTKGRLAIWKFGILRGKKRRFQPGRNYCGFNPSASNCRLHSAGASRSRSTPMPRSKRPSTAALTRSGARKASEILALSHRTLQKWRARGIGPTFMKFSRTIRYPVAELVVWTEQNRATPARSIHQRETLMNNRQNADPDALLTEEQTSQFLNISVRTV